MKSAIGGYFELELPQPCSTKFHGALKYQSARVAFLALLLACKAKRVWMPNLICDAMLAPVSASGAEILFYCLDDRFGIADDIVLDSADILLYVNYFGVCLGESKKVLERFDPSQVVLDFSQAFFDDPQNCLATIYSPRKFFGIPDGGFLITDVPVKGPRIKDTGSVDRCRHLLKRLDSSSEMGYPDFQQAEASLWDLTPRKMSHLSERIFSGIDFNTAKQRRNKNFHFLHQQLKQFNTIKIDLSSIDTPMCYPLVIKTPVLRKRLLEERVFVPIYWPEVIDRVARDSMEWHLVDRCMPLPCDQRYTLADMAKVVKIVRETSQ